MLLEVKMEILGAIIIGIFLFCLIGTGVWIFFQMGGIFTVLACIVIIAAIGAILYGGYALFIKE